MGATAYTEDEAAADGVYDQYDPCDPQDMREAYVPYRALSRTAVASVIIGLLGLSALTAVPLLMLPALGLVLGMLGLRTIRRYPAEFSGRGLAIAGILGNTLLLLGASTLHTVIYMTEVPEGATRISFRELQPTRETPDLPVSPRALELDGQRVFVKGYVYPDGQQGDIRRAVWVVTAVLVYYLYYTAALLLAAEVAAYALLSVVPAWRPAYRLRHFAVDLSLVAIGVLPSIHQVSQIAARRDA